MTKIMYKPHLEYHSPNSWIKTCSMKLTTPKHGNINIVTDVDEEFGYVGVDENLRKYIDFRTIIYNSKNKKMGYEALRLYEDMTKLDGEDIVTEPKFRNTHIGEIMRLVSVITMLENKLPSINIYALQSAVPFHVKYKFLPIIRDKFDANCVLNTIIRDTEWNIINLIRNIILDTKNLHKRAVKLQQDSHFISPERFCAETQIITDEYFNKIQSNRYYKKKHFFPSGEMILTAENVKQNKDFFNSLFIKHGIDYQI